jgi:multidrug transporter EmrE-like cation transporter
MQFILLIILAQALYSASDLVRKFILHGQEFDLTLLRSLPMWITLALSGVGFVIQLFVLKHYDLSRTITILACCAIVFSVALGAIFFKEKFNLVNYAGVALAVVAVILTHVGHNS